MLYQGEIILSLLSEVVLLAHSNTVLVNTDCGLCTEAYTPNNLPTEQGRPSGSSGHAQTKSVARAKQRWVQPPLFTPQAFVPKGYRQKI